jgi:hypothetical protein
MKTQLAGLAAALVTVTAVVATPASAAWGEEDGSRLRDRCLHAVDRRLERLDRASERIRGARHLTAAHRTMLTDQLTATAASLTRLRGKIASESGDALKEDCRSVAVDHRVYVLVLPRARLVAAGDAELAAVGKFVDVAKKLEAAIDKAADAGRDMREERADLASMRAYVDSARDGASGIAGSILDLTPADWNDDHTVLDPARKAAIDARLDLRSAHRLGREIRQDLRR